MQLIASAVGSFSTTADINASVTTRSLSRQRGDLTGSTVGSGELQWASAMETEELKEILIELVDLVGSLEKEIRSLEVLTSHRVDPLVTEQLGIPQTTNALHAQVQSLRARVCQFNNKNSLG